MAELTTSEIPISDLPTKSVILAPNQVTVVREIHTTIQPGQNEISILGLDPHVNTDSIRIEGSGTATITDIRTDVIPRRERFEDVYPAESESDDELSSGDDQDKDDDVSGDESDPQIHETRKEIGTVEKRLAKAQSDIGSSQSVLDFLNGYGNAIKNDEERDVSKLNEFLDIYLARRDAEADRNYNATIEQDACQKELLKLRSQLQKRKAKYVKEQRAQSKAARLQKEDRARAREQKRTQRRLKASELMKFWTSSVGRVIVCLDSQAPSPSPPTPGSIPEGEPINITLRLSYIIPGSSWISRYELQINSPSCSAQMAYRAEFKNTSSETWRDASVTLSTLQAPFSGIGAHIPSLKTWNIALVSAAVKTPSWGRILDTREAYPAPVSSWAPRARLSSAPPPPPPVPAARQRPLFGMPAGQSQPSLFGASPAPAPTSGGLFGGAGRSEPTRPAFGVAAQTDSSSAAESTRGGGLFKSPSQPEAQSSSLFGVAQSGPGSVDAQPSPGGFAALSNTQSQSMGSFARPSGSRAPRLSVFGRASASPNTRSPFDVGDESTTTTDPEAPQTSNTVSTAVELEDEDEDDTASTLTSSILGHQDSIKKHHGMTTTYELPGQRTLAPSYTPRRHVLADLDLQTVSLTYVIVPKLREAAFLRARIQNTSALTLHKGAVGITVDGSFLGTASLDTCGPNIFFNVSLGIDPGIEVKYMKPTVKPIAGAMFFAKEDGARFRRSAWVKNTKASAVDLIVSDQIPVSEDEKLRVRVLYPGGLESEGDEVGVKMERRVGVGKVALRKNGEVKWTLRLESEQEIRLVVEYETKVPSGSDVSPA
ncbi:hypothetical protein BJX99DRAFT_240621 [Aspergillus californicus]